MLESERLKFRKFTDEDITYYMQLSLNYEVMKYITRRAMTEDEAKERYAKLMEMTVEYPELGCFVVTKKEDDTFIGLAKFTYMKEGQVEVGYSLLPEFWGQKYASEIVERLIEYAKGIDMIKELIGITDPKNAVSQRVLTKYNFELYEKGFFHNLPAEYFKLKIRE